MKDSFGHTHYLESYNIDLMGKVIIGIIDLSTVEQTNHYLPKGSLRGRWA